MSFASSTKRRLDVKDAKRVLRESYLRTPNPSAAQLRRIADEIGRSVESVTKWFEKERLSSQTTTPEPTLQKNRSEERLKDTSARAIAGSGSKPPARSTPSVLNPKRSAPVPKPGPTAVVDSSLSEQSPVLQSTQTRTQPARPAQPAQPVRPVQPVRSVQPVQTRLEAQQASLPSSAPSQPAQSQVVSSRVTATETVAPQTKTHNLKGKEREEIASIDHDVEMEDQSATVDQPASEDEDHHAPTLDANRFPMAFEGVTKLQHELHCAMLLYYQATQGLPMTLPDSLPSK